MHKIFPGNRVTRIILSHEHGQSEQFNFLKSIKKINIPANIINLCKFITDPLKSSRIIFIKVYPEAKASEQPDFSFENESTICTVITVMIDNYGRMKAVTNQTGCAILQNSY